MKLAVALTLALIAPAAFATGLDVTPKVPVDCKQQNREQVSFVTASPITGDRTLRLSLNLQHGTCASGSFAREPVATNYNLYVIEREYSRDFWSKHERADANSVSVEMGFTPDEFFALTNIRHFDLHFYPNPNGVVFVWLLTFSRDPVTGIVRLSAKELAPPVRTLLPTAKSLDGMKFCRNVTSSGRFGQPKGTRKHCLEFAEGEVRDNASTFFGKGPRRFRYTEAKDIVRFNGSRYEIAENFSTLTRLGTSEDVEAVFKRARR